MTKKILFLLVLVTGIALQAMAQESKKDSVFVIKNGRIAGAFEVGTDVDNIQFQKKATPVEGNVIKIGDMTIEMKSAVVQRKNNMNYIYLAAEEGLTTVKEMINTEYLAVVVSDNLLGKDITLSEFDEDSDDYFYVYYITTDGNEPTGADAYEWSDYFSDGTLRVDKTDDNLTLQFAWTGTDGNSDFSGSYDGGYTYIKESPYYFTVDGNRTDLKAAFVEEKSDGVALYLTSGDIDDAKRLEDVYYYARVFVPTSALDGRTIDITGNSEYEFDFIDNRSDEKIYLSNGSTGSATGTISVKKNEDGTYEVQVDVAGMGSDADRSLAAYYVGTPLTYDISVPNVYSVGGEEKAELKSAVVKHDSDGLYTIYLSSKAGVTTEAGMADADIVVTVPEVFMTDETKGFSGTENNAKISVTYDGATYNQASCKGTGALAIGGNVKAKLDGTTVTVTFNVYSISKYSGSLSGYFSGTATVL